MKSPSVQELRQLLERVDASTTAGEGIHRHDEDPLIEGYRWALDELQRAHRILACERGDDPGAAVLGWSFDPVTGWWVRRDATLRRVVSGGWLLDIYFHSRDRREYTAFDFALDGMEAAERMFAEQLARKTRRGR